MKKGIDTEKIDAVFDLLNITELEARKGNIGCPFADSYLKKRARYDKRVETCILAGHTLYPRLLQKSHWSRCPCHRGRPSYVKQRFWKLIREYKKRKEVANG